MPGQHDELIADPRQPLAEVHLRNRQATFDAPGSGIQLTEFGPSPPAGTLEQLAVVPKQPLRERLGVVRKHAVHVDDQLARLVVHLCDRRHAGC